MITVVVMVAGACLAVFAAFAAQQRQSAAPTAIPGVPPGSLDRNDFRAPEAPVLIAVFTSATCSSCDAVWAELAGYESPQIATQNIEFGEDAALHERYGIESVPTAVVVDATGETQAAFVGPLGPDHRQVLAGIVAG